MKIALLLAGMMIALSAIAQVPNQATARFASQESTPDTNSDSAFWNDAPAITFMNDTYGKPVPGHESEVRAQWTRENLYFFLVCPYEEMNLKPDPSTTTEYKEFELSPQGEWVDLDIDLSNSHHKDGWLWNSGFQVAARVDAVKKIWYGFMRIPYRAVDSRDAMPGNELRINFYRIQGPDHKLINWQPIQKPSFHVPESFGTWKLVSGN